MGGFSYKNILADTAADLPVEPHGPRILWDLRCATTSRVLPLSFAELLRNRRDLVVRHPDLNPDHKKAGLKPVPFCGWVISWRVHSMFISIIIPTAIPQSAQAVAETNGPGCG